MTTTLICPECGVTFDKVEKRQVFCSKAHGKRFYNLQTKRGTVIGPLLTVARMAGRYSGVDKELGAYARKEADNLISRWIQEDRAAGRDAALIVKAKMEAGWCAADVD